MGGFCAFTINSNETEFASKCLYIVLNKKTDFACIDFKTITICERNIWIHRPLIHTPEL